MHAGSTVYEILSKGLSSTYISGKLLTAEFSLELTGRAPVGIFHT